MAKMKNLLWLYQQCGDDLYKKTIHFNDAAITLYRDSHGRLLGRCPHAPHRTTTTIPTEIQRSKRLKMEVSHAR